MQRLGERVISGRMKLVWSSGVTPDIGYPHCSEHLLLRILGVLVQLLKDEESHMDFLEAQMHLIRELGYERYLTQPIGEGEE